MPRKAGSTGSDAGRTQNRDNYLPPMDPRPGVEMVLVPEVEPLIATFYARDGRAGRTAPDGAYFDAEAAARAVSFIEERLFLFEGRWAGLPFTLQLWQRRIVEELFGWMQADGTRLYRMAYVEVPRKNGKSTFAAAVALYLAYEDGEAGAQVFFAAADKEQANVCYGAARRFLQQDEAMANASVIYNSTKRILIPDTHSEIRCLSSDTKKLYGLNLHGLVFDELMAQPNRTLWDALTSSQGARLQPLVLAITTAGFDRESVAYEQREYARNIASGDIVDPGFLGVVYGAEEGDDFRDPEVWKRATPSLGATVDLAFYEREAKVAEGQPGKQNAFRTLYLSQWVGQATRLIPMTGWDAGNAPDKYVDLDALDGAVCTGGLDLSSSIDLTAFVLDFARPDGSHFWLPRIWVPADGLRDKGLRDRAPYDVWAEQGYLETTPGRTIDYAYIRAAVLEAAERYQLRAVSYDRWGATQLAQELEHEGVAMAKMGQGFASMSAPTKEMLRLVTNEQLLTNGHPVLRWMADNAAGMEDPAGNLKLARDRSGVRIDGLVAGVMALDANLRVGMERRSVYDDYGPDDIFGTETA